MTLAGAAPETGATSAEPEDPLAVRLEREIRAGQISLPVLPQIGVQVQELIDNDASIRALVQVIEREPTIAAALLKYANSAMYTGLRDVTDLQQAVMRLGLNSVQKTVLAISTKSAFGGGDSQFKGLYQTIWSHSLTAAIAARRLAAMIGLPPETAFLAGLLHDIGKIIVLRGISTLRKRDPKGFVVADDTVMEFMDALHCKLGDVLCDAWRIPAELRQAITRHHDHALAGPRDSLVAVVQIADLLAAKMGASLRPDQHLTLLDKPASVILQLDDVKVAMLLVDLEDDLQQLKGLF